MAVMAWSAEAYPSRIEAAVEEAVRARFQKASLEGFSVDADGYDLVVSGEASHPVQLSKIEALLADLDVDVDVARVKLPDVSNATPASAVDLRVSRSADGLVIRGRVPNKARGGALSDVVSGVLGEPVADEDWTVSPVAQIPSLDVFATSVASLDAVARGGLTWSASGVALVGQGTDGQKASMAQRVLHAVAESGVDVEIRLTWPDGVEPWLVASRDAGGVQISGVVEARQRKRIESLWGSTDIVDLTSVGASNASGFGKRAAGAINVLAPGAGRVRESSDQVDIRGSVPADARTTIGSDIRYLARGKGLKLELGYLTESCSAGLRSVRVGSRDPAADSDVMAVLDRIAGCPARQFELPAALGAPTAVRAVATGRWMRSLGEFGLDLRRVVSWDKTSPTPPL